MIELISQPYYGFTYPILSDGVVKTFIHKSCEPKAFIRDMLSHTENLIGIDFKVIRKQRKAEIRFFEIPLIANEPTYVGLAVPYVSPIGNVWDIYVKTNPVSSKQWIYLHEFGHFLGMEHPFDDNDNDVWYNESTNDTVMSYNYQPSSYWWFRQADIDTITGMWVS
jgi:serralysin